MPIFSDKSGKRRFFVAVRRLTPGLPDVPTADALPGPLIRLAGQRSTARELLEDCLQGAEIEYQSSVMGRGEAEIPQVCPASGDPAGPAISSPAAPASIIAGGAGQYHRRRSRLVSKDRPGCGF
jgi:hypothetical protein